MADEHSPSIYNINLESHAYICKMIKLGCPLFEVHSVYMPHDYG